jgi:hypothetical protein
MGWTCGLDEETRNVCTVSFGKSFAWSNTEKHVLGNIKTYLWDECYKSVNSLRVRSGGKFSKIGFESSVCIATETAMYLFLMTFCLFNQVVCGMQACLCQGKMLTGIWNMRQGCIGCNGCQQLRNLAEFIPAQYLLPSCHNQKRYQLMQQQYCCIVTPQSFGSLPI